MAWIDILFCLIVDVLIILGKQDWGKNEWEKGNDICKMEKRGTTPGSTITIMVNLKSLDLSVKWKENIISVALKWEHRNKIKTCMLKNPVEWFIELAYSCHFNTSQFTFFGLQDWQGTHVSTFCQLSILDVRRTPTWRTTICRYIFELNFHMPSFYWFIVYSVHPGMYITCFCCSLRCT